MAEPIYFEQDPEEDEIGVGYFTFADGSRRYSRDPELAKKLPKPGAPAEQSEAAPETQQPEPGLQESLTTRAAPAAAPSSPPPVAPAVAPSAAASKMPAAASTSQHGSSTTGATSSSVQRTGSAMPEDVYQQGQADIQQAYQSAIANERASTERAAVQSDNAARAAAEQGKQMEAAAAAATAQNAVRQAQTQAKMKEIAARPTESIWGRKGIPGTIAGLIGVALSGVGDRMLGRENGALEEINRQKQQHMQEQLHQKDSELNALARELGSLEAAVPIYEMRMDRAIKKQAEAQLLGEKTQTGLAAGQRFIDALNVQMVESLKKGSEAYYGTQASQQATSSQQTVTDEETLQRRAAPTGVGVKTDDQLLKALVTARDLGMMSRAGITYQEAEKEVKDYRERAAKQNDFRGSLDELARTLGVTVSVGKDGKVAVSGDPSPGKRFLGIDALSSEQAHKVNRAYSRVQRADIMSMLREPSRDLQDAFAAISERPFYDSEIVGQLQEMYDLSQRLQRELDAGYNPVVPEIYNGRGGAPPAQAGAAKGGLRIVGKDEQLAP